MIVNPNGQNHLPGIHTNPQAARVIDAFKRGLFAPYEAALRKPNEFFVSAFDKIQDSVKAKEVSLLVTYLFVIAIDPALGEEVKKRIIAEALTLKDAVDQLTHDLSHEFPPVMSVHILRYCSKNIWEEVCQKILKNRWILVYEKPLFEWMQEAVKYEWGSAFIDRLFECLPVNEQRDVVCYFLIYGDKKQLEATNLASLAKNLESEVEIFGNSCVSNGERKPIPFKDNQRKLFLAWFIANAIDNDLIAVTFNEKDWVWLKERLGGKIASYSLQWMIGIAKKQEFSRPDTEDIGVSLFFYNASKNTPEIEGLMEAFDALNLSRYYNSLQHPLQSKLVKDLVTKDPQKLVAWLLHGLTSLKITLVLQYKPSIKVLLSNISLIVRIYGMADQSQGKQILTTLFANKKEGIESVVTWVNFSLQNSAYRDCLLKHFPQLLVEIDPSLPSTIRSRLSVKPEEEEFIALLLPPTYIADPKARQSHALQKLLYIFSNTTLSSKERDEFVSTIRDDLEGIKGDLFDRLPETSWPLIFMHFGFPICHEKKSKGEAIDWIAICAKTLLHAPRYFKTHEDYRYSETLYDIAEHLKITRGIIIRYSEIAPPGSFFSTMQLFGGDRKEGFWTTVAESIEKAFLVQCFKANITDEFIWKPPYLKNDQEITDAAKQLFLNMSVFELSNPLLKNIITSINATDPAFCMRLFHDSMTALMHSSDETQGVCFQNLCISYRKAGISLTPLIQKYEASAKQWYRAPEVKNWVAVHPVGFALLKMYNSDLLVPTAHHKITLELGDAHISLYHINDILAAAEDDRDKIQLSQQERTRLKEAYESRISECFMWHHSMDLFCSLVPDWKTRLNHWIMEQIKSAKERGRSYGEAPDYYTIIKIFSPNNPKFSEWAAEFKQSATGAEIWKQYEAKQTKQ